MKQEKKQVSVQSNIKSSDLTSQLKQLLNGNTQKNCSFKINHTTPADLDIEKSCTLNEIVKVKDEDKNSNIIHFFTINICSNDNTFIKPKLSKSSTCATNFGSRSSLLEKDLETNFNTPISSSKSMFFKSESTESHEKFGKRLEGPSKRRFNDINFKNAIECQSCSIFCDGSCENSITEPFTSKDQITSLNEKMNVDNLYSLGGIIYL